MKPNTNRRGGGLVFLIVEGFGCHVPEGKPSRKKTPNLHSILCIFREGRWFGWDSTTLVFTCIVFTCMAYSRSILEYSRILASGVMVSGSVLELVMGHV